MAPADRRGQADIAERRWAERVRANREQVDRVREVADGADFYRPVSSLFVADPRRTDDALLDDVLSLARPSDTWLDIGAGAGRFALPIALVVREVIAIDSSRSMLDALRSALSDHRIGNVRVVHGRWPEVLSDLGSPPVADVAFIAHVGYDIEAIGPFLGAMEFAAGRECVAVLMERPPATLADPFWPIVHGEGRMPLPALPEFLDLLEAWGRQPEVHYVERHRRRFRDRAEVRRFLFHQLWVDPVGPKGRRLEAAIDEAIVQRPDGIELRHDEVARVGIVRWRPPTRVEVGL
jgi:SAM-dependent methyltransferase